MFARVVFGTWHGDESSPLHCVVPFNRRSCIRSVPGTAHRPFPTVSLEGFTSASFVSTMRNAARPSQSPVVTALPKGEPRSLFRYVSPLRPLFLQCGNVVPPLIHRLWRSPFPEGEGFGADLWAVPENYTPESTVQKLPLGEAGSPEGEPDEGPRGGVKHSRNSRRIRRNVPLLSFRPQRQRSGGIFYVG